MPCGAARAATAVVLLLALAAVGCGPRPAPAAGLSTGAPPDLRGQDVMVFPVQSVRGGVEGADAELAYALAARGSSVAWLLPARLEEALRRAPGVQARLHGLPVGIFLRTEVNRVGDPLFGELRRLAALTGSDLALIPVEVRLGPASEAAGPGSGSASGGAAVRDAPVEIAAALISARTGRVFWFGIVEGEPGPPGDARALASAADVLARTLVY